MTIQRLPKAASAAIVSTSMIQSQLSVVKELVENAIDAIGINTPIGGVKNTKIHNIQIEIDKDSAGLDYISVKDDGCGVNKEDRNMMCLNYTTSKLHSVDDLMSGVDTCGFRGEALNLIAKLVESMVISTRTSSDAMSETWSVSNSGTVTSSPISSAGLQGTTVKIYGLFKATPVRYKFLQSHKSKYIKEIESLITKYALIYPSIRFQIKYIKLLPLNKVKTLNTLSYSNRIPRTQFIYQILQIRSKDWLTDENINFTVGDSISSSYSVNVECVLPKMRAQDIPNVKTPLKVLTVNNRPLNLSLKFGKEISKLVGEAYLENKLLSPNVWYISVEVPTDKIDVNIEPEKSDILIVNESNFLVRFKDNLIFLVQKIHNIQNETDEQLEPESTETDAKDNNDKICTIDENVIPDMLDDDESFIEELDSTIKRIQNRHPVKFDDNIEMGTVPLAQTYQNNSSPGPLMDLEVTSDCQTLVQETPEISQMLNIEVTSDPESQKSNKSYDNYNNEKTSLTRETNEYTNTEREQHDQEEDDNNWSRTIYDTTGISSEMDIPQESSHNSQNIENINPSHISIANPWTTAKLSNEIHRSNEETLFVGNLSDDAYEPHVVKSKELPKAAKLLPLQQKSNDKNSDTKKQMKISSFGTYCVDEKQTKKMKPKVNKVRLSRVTDLSQKLFNTIVTAEIDYTINKIDRKQLLLDDEVWVASLKIPSENIINGVLSLYNQVDYRIENDRPVLNEFNLYQLK